MKITTLLDEWELEYTEDTEKLTVKGVLGQGSVHYRQRKIYIDERLNLQDREKVIRHELTHVVLYETQIRLVDSYSEEDICEFMAKFGRYINTLVNNIIDT